jgi:acetyl esterase/lipase
MIQKYLSVMALAVTFSLASVVAQAQPPGGPPPEEAISESVPDSIQVYKTIDDKQLKAHIFYPEGHNADDQTPALVFFHGGGLRRGSASQGYAVADDLLPTGVAVIAVEYRLLDTPDRTLDQIIADSKSAVRWVRSNADDLGLDPDRIATIGHSAGAFLALSSGVMTRFDEATEDSAVSSVPNAMILWSPTLVRRDNPENSMVPANLTMADLTPQTYLRGSLSPATFIVGSEDPIAKPDAVKAFEEKYSAAGNQSEFHIINGADHFFANKDHRQQAMELIRAFLNSSGYAAGK